MNPIRRTLVLAAALVVGLSLIFLLPESVGLRDSAIIKAYPERMGDWRCKVLETPPRVAEILGEETAHEHAVFYRPSPNGGRGVYDRLSMFIVVSGNEMNASIHRPERCFPTQGFTITDSSEVAIPVSGSEEALEVTRLASHSTTEAGQTLPRLAYYWFVGHDQMTNSHYERAWIDIKDRLFKGSNQRWAYVMATVDYAQRSEQSRPLSEAEADQMLQSFLGDLFPHLHRTDQLRG